MNEHRHRARLLRIVHLRVLKSSVNRVFASRHLKQLLAWFVLQHQLQQSEWTATNNVRKKRRKKKKQHTTLFHVRRMENDQTDREITYRSRAFIKCLLFSWNEWKITYKSNRSLLLFFFVHSPVWSRFENAQPDIPNTDLFHSLA